MNKYSILERILITLLATLGLSVLCAPLTLYTLGVSKGGYGFIGTGFMTFVVIPVGVKDLYWIRKMK